jgi:hypothetical protein
VEQRSCSTRGHIYIGFHEGMWHTFWTLTSADPATPLPGTTVSRIQAASQTYNLELTLDVNTEIYPMMVCVPILLPGRRLECMPALPHIEAWSQPRLEHKHIFPR